MILYMNKFASHMLIAYYNKNNKVTVDIYNNYSSNDWENIYAGNYKCLSDLRDAIIKADMCDILHDDGIP